MDLVQEVEAVFAQGGTLSTQPGTRYKPRPQQIEMTRLVARTFAEGGIAVIEAGTGVGKSYAYLVPSLLWLTHQLERRDADARSARVIVATNKINLQHQLTDRDIPDLLRALGSSVKLAVFKGRTNYLSLRRLRNALSTGHESLFRWERDQQKALRIIESWARETATGDWADLEERLEIEVEHGTVTPEQRDAVAQAWPLVHSDYHDCMEVACPFFRRCYFFRARQGAEEAQLIVTNQHILTLDRLFNLSNENASILPGYERVIIDEAHSLVETVTSVLTRSITERSVVRLVDRLLGDAGRRRRRGLLDEFRDQLENVLPGSPLVDLVGPDFEEMLAGIRSLWQECFHSLSARIGQTATAGGALAVRYPFAGAAAAVAAGENPDFEKGRQLFSEETGAALKRCLAKIDSADFRRHQDMHDVAVRFSAILQMLDEHLATLRDFADLSKSSASSDPLCRWIQCTGDEEGKTTLTLSVAPVDVSGMIAQLLSGEQMKTVVLTSATLTVEGRFDYILSEWGLNSRFAERGGQTLMLDSPFDYAGNCLFAIPEDLPDPQKAKSQFTPEACEMVEEILKITRGRAFLLFTSWADLDAFWEELAPRLRKKGFSPMRQERDGRRIVLVRIFRERERPVLFGTVSFWEGVDIPGDALSCVIIVKLPFPVPTEPMFEARAEHKGLVGIERFRQLSVPAMITRLRQGFGRLIRTETDHGVVVLLDKRATSKSYSDTILKSVPPARLVTGSRTKILHELRRMFPPT
jgi:ATP-dependent DNA helicase DinG